jgi:carbon starvation protein
MIGVLCVLAIAYRYYSAFIAARVMALDDTRQTPAHTMNDGQNYYPTNKWVLFGHHFAAISGSPAPGRSWGRSLRRSLVSCRASSGWS